MAPWKRKPKTKHSRVKISDELAKLGYYARSMKPRKRWLVQRTSPDPSESYVSLAIFITRIVSTLGSDELLAAFGAGSAFSQTHLHILVTLLSLFIAETGSAKSTASSSPPLSTSSSILQCLIYIGVEKDSGYVGAL